MAVNLAHDVPTSFIREEQISSGGNGMDMRRATGTMPSWPAKEVTELGRNWKVSFWRCELITEMLIAHRIIASSDAIGYPRDQ